VERFVSRAPCPLIIGAACAIYAARPLACRGHVSFDREACIAIAAGQDAEAPASEVHKTVRALVQNALQAAMRDAGLSWGAYEFLAALDRCCRTRNARRDGRRGSTFSRTCNLGRSSRLRWRKVSTPCGNTDVRHV